MVNAVGKPAPLAVLVCALLAGCASIGPEALQQNRFQYNEIVKTTSEEQLLLNIVRPELIVPEVY
jgi:starvation-inducible outer membrane lipoprotein